MKKAHKMKGKKPVAPSVDEVFRKRVAKPEADDKPKPGAGGKFKPAEGRLSGMFGKKEGKRAKKLRGVML